jgi:hypothetical protein
MAHGVLIRSCSARLQRKFFNAPDSADTIDTDCIGDEAPPFFVDAAGPAQ